jgi:hypothetical protein
MAGVEWVVNRQPVPAQLVTHVAGTFCNPCLLVGPKIDGGPGRSRTADQRFRKPLLYPTELRGHPARPTVIDSETTENSYEDSEHLYSSELRDCKTLRLRSDR